MSPSEEKVGPKRSALLQERSRQTRRRLVVAALRLWSERGYEHGIEETTAAEIARSAGVSKNTFYLHFARKEDVLLEIGWGTAQELYDDAANLIAQSAAPTEVLEQVQRSLARQIARSDHRAVARSIAEFKRAMAVGYQPRERGLRLANVYSAVIQYGIDRGEVNSSTDIDDVGRMLEAVSMEAVEWWTTGGVPDLQKVLLQRMELILLAVRNVSTP